MIQMQRPIRARVKRSSITSPLSVDWSDEDSIVGAIEALYQSRSELKYSLEREWYQNIAWYMGFQYLIWGRSTSRLYEPKAPSWRVRLVVNFLQSTIRTLASKLYKNAPEWDVIPATTDAADLQISQVSGQLLDADWYRMDMPSKTIEILLWMLTTGNIFPKMYWDPEAGDPVFLPGIEGVELDEPLAVGETTCELVPPFSMLIDPQATVFRDAQWSLESKRVNIHELIEQYPRAEGLTASGVDRGTHLFPFLKHLKTLSSRGNPEVTYASNIEADKDAIMVHEWWIRPRNRKRSKLKKGKMIVMAGNRVLNGDGKGVDFPYHHGMLPYAHMGEVYVPGRLWYDCTLNQMKHLQMDYNRSASQLIENRNLTSRPKWAVPKGSGISDAALTSQPGEKVHHNPGFKPEPIEPPQTPNYVREMMTRHKEDMEDISGVHEVSRAQAPGQIRSGRGVLALIEQDESRLGLVLRHIEEQFSRLGKMDLALSAQFVTETRIARIIGHNDELLLFNYDGNSLVGGSATLPGVNYFDVRVRTTVGFPNSRAAQMDLLATLLENRVLLPEQNPRDRRLVLQTLSIGTIEDHLDKARVHRSRQLREIEQMVQGIPTKAEEWHDHEVHLDVLNEFRNSARYDNLPSEQQQMVTQHAAAHEEWIALLQVKPELMVRKAAMLGMVQMKMGMTGQLAANEGSNLMADGGASAPQPKQQPMQQPALPQGAQNGQEQ
jgi:hypothetical protein